MHLLLYIGCVFYVDATALIERSHYSFWLRQRATDTGIDTRIGKTQTATRILQRDLYAPGLTIDITAHSLVTIDDVHLFFSRVGPCLNEGGLAHTATTTAASMPHDQQLDAPVASYVLQSADAVTSCTAILPASFTATAATATSASWHGYCVCSCA